MKRREGEEGDEREEEGEYQAVGCVYEKYLLGWYLLARAVDGAGEAQSRPGEEVGLEVLRVREEGDLCGEEKCEEYVKSM